MRKNFKSYVFFIFVSLGAGLLSALLTMGNMNIYREITRPPLSPPAILFPIVWTVLYILMGAGAATVHTRAHSGTAGPALAVFFLQLAVNFFWSLIFFNLRAWLWAFVWLLILWGLIFVMIKRFGTVSPLAAKLQLPYLLWVTFAGYLTLAIYILNR